MKKILQLCLMLSALAVAAEKPVIEGKWEGQLNGLKAITLAAHESKGQIEGSVVFYVMRDDDGKGMKVVGQDERKMLDTNWDGKSLKFAVGAPSFDPDGSGARFTMTMTGDKKADLKRAGANAVTLPLVRVE